MFGLDGSMLLFVALATLSVGFLAYAIFFSTIQSEKKVGRRLDTIKRAETDRATVKASRDRVAEAARRRRSVHDSLKELEQRQTARDNNMRKPPLKIQIRQAGMEVTMKRFYVYSVVCAIVLALLVLIAGGGWLVALGAMVA